MPPKSGFCCLSVFFCFIFLFSLIYFIVGYKPSSQLFDFIRNLGESTSRQAERDIILKEMENMKSEYPKLELKKSSMREFLLKMIYCEMLGFDVSNYHIVAIKMTQQTNLYNKYTGLSPRSMR
jgi:AP-4 complex subunit epsilon-1